MLRSRESGTVSGMTDCNVRRIAFVSGASRGIGAHICRLLVKRGMIVIGCARSVETIKTIAEERPLKKSTGELHAMKCDLTNEIEILAMFKEIRRRFGRVDVCVNNTCLNKFNLVTPCETKDLKKFLELNIMAVGNCTRECLKLMNNCKEGMIIQVVQCGIVSGKQIQLTTPEYSLGYGMNNGVNFAITALADALRQELKSTGSKISVRCIYPGSEVMNFIYGRQPSSETIRILINTERFEEDVVLAHLTKILDAGNKETAKDVPLIPDDFK